ncbi:cytidylate kinase family protein [Patescibacteria group bacterium]|nr:cytidylate kinase family protein [Patescibacteria group bacterium]
MRTTKISNGVNPIITISGTPGSGKSTVAKNLLKKYKAERVYVGGLWREIATEKNMTLEELNEYVINHPKADIEMDKRASKKARELAKKSMVIVEGRTQFIFLPESIKLFIKADINETAKRVWQQLKNDKHKERQNESHIKSLEEMITKQKHRKAQDIKRYKKVYKIDYTDEKNYDFVLDTTKLSIDQAAQKVADFINKTVK